MAKDKRSFFERLTGTVKLEHNDEEENADYEPHRPERKLTPSKTGNKEESMSTEWIEESNEEGQLTADVYQTPTDIVIKTIVAGVKPDDLDISISRDMVTLRGSREESREVSDDDYFHRELYWGSFSRTILLPEEIDVEASEAVCRDGLLTIRLPKIDKRRQTKLKVKSS